MALADIGDDELAYLQPDFDPTTLRVAELRKVLLTHDISYGGSAKKADLIDIFERKLRPKAPKILAAHRRIQRTSRGIEDAVSSTASTQEDEEETPPVEATPARRTRGRPRKTPQPNIIPSLEVDDDDDATLLAPSTTARRSTRGSSKTYERPTMSRSRSRATESRRSTVTPAIKEEDEPAAWYEQGDAESPFSHENPFQSGSSPLVAPQSHRRKSEGPATEKKRKSENRRRTDNPASTVTRRSVVDVPVRSAHQKQKPQDDGLEPGEEFEPEEQLALEKAQREGRAAVVPVRRPRTQRNESYVKQGITSVVLVIGFALSTFWAEEKFNVGYCGVGQASEVIHGLQIPEWADSARPQCEPCPQHAQCFSKLYTKCDKDFVLKQHPLNVGGLLPIPPKCEADSEKSKRVKEVADFTVNKLRSASAAAECGEAATAEITVEDLKAEVVQRAKRKLSHSELEALWADAIEDVEGRGEIITTVDEGGSRTFRSTSLAKVGIACTVRRSVKRTVEHYIRSVITAFLIILASSGLLWTVRDNLATTEQAKILASAVFQSLADHAADVAYDPAGRDGYVSVYQLRDDVMRDEFSTSRRKKLWKRVEQLVEQNSNIRARLGALDTGDVGRGWKWIGAIRQLEDSASRSGSRRGSKRFSLPAPTDSSPMTELAAKGSYSGKDIFTRWEDTSRPQF